MYYLGKNWTSKSYFENHSYFQLAEVRQNVTKNDEIWTQGVSRHNKTYVVEFLKFRFFSNLWCTKIAKTIVKSPKVANISQKMKFQKFLQQKVILYLDTPPVQISSF